MLKALPIGGGTISWWWYCNEVYVIHHDAQTIRRQHEQQESKSLQIVLPTAIVGLQRLRMLSGNLEVKISFECVVCDLCIDLLLAVV